MFIELNFSFTESNSTELAGDVWKNESEPEWEGFDAGSAESSSETVSTCIQCRSFYFTMVTSH